LRKRFPEHKFIELPKKHFIGNLSTDIIQARRVMLEAFLEDILAKSDVCDCSELVIFLSPSDNYKQAEHVKNRVTKLVPPSQAKVLLKEKKRSKVAKGKSASSLPNTASTLRGKFSHSKAKSTSQSLNVMPLVTVDDLQQFNRKKQETNIPSFVTPRNHHVRAASVWERPTLTPSDPILLPNRTVKKGSGLSFASGVLPKPDSPKLVQTGTQKTDSMSSAGYHKMNPKHAGQQ
jgi:hypothetical protein